jgi:hypothetical protein
MAGGSAVKLWKAGKTMAGGFEVNPTRLPSTSSGPEHVEGSSSQAEPLNSEP